MDGERWLRFPSSPRRRRGASESNIFPHVEEKRARRQRRQAGSEILPITEQSQKQEEDRKRLVVTLKIFTINHLQQSPDPCKTDEEEASDCSRNTNAETKTTNRTELEWDGGGLPGGFIQFTHFDLLAACCRAVANSSVQLSVLIYT